MDLVTLAGIELMTVGMKWQTANGEVTFTFEHLADAMTAANEDPHVVPPRLALGHDDPRFATEEELTNKANPFYDGEPAFGQVVNLRLENDGAVLMGDFVNVPAWLAEVMPSAYPSRSIEGACLNGGWDVETPGGKHYSFVLTRCSLLGIFLPAVQDLEDLQAVLTTGEGVQVVKPGGGIAPVAGMGDVTPELRASVDKVVRLFMDEVATEETGRYWWWARDIYTDPNQIVADDDEGGLWLVDFTSDEKQNVTFADPVKVLETFVPAPADQAAAARAVLGRDEPARHFADRVAAGARERPEGGVKPSATTGVMDVEGEKIRKALGLTAEATDDEVQAKLDEQAEAAPDTPPETPDPEEGTETPEPATEPEEEPSTAEPEAETEPVAASDGTVKVSKDVWEQTQRQARDGAAAREEQLVEAREGKLEDAVKAGKITPASKDDWRKKLVSAPAATARELEELAPGLVPVEEKGTSKEADQSGEVPEAVMASFPSYRRAKS